MLGLENDDFKVVTVGFFGTITPLIEGFDVVLTLTISALTITYLLLKIKQQWKQRNQK